MSWKQNFIMLQWEITRGSPMVSSHTQQIKRTVSFALSIVGQAKLDQIKIKTLEHKILHYSADITEGHLET